MTGCEGFEVEIEMWRHGALDASRVPALEAHLAECPSCRRYQALARRTEQTMIAQTLHVNGLEARILQLHDHRRSRSWWALGVPAVLALSLAVLTHKPLWVFVTCLPVALVIFAALRLRLAAQARATARLGRDQADYLAHYRALLDGRIRRIRILLGVIPLFAVLTFLQAEVWHLWPASMRQPAVYAVIGGALGLAFLKVLWMRLRDVPALRKERRDLDAA